MFYQTLWKISDIPKMCCLIWELHAVLQAVTFTGFGGFGQTTTFIIFRDNIARIDDRWRSEYFFITIYFVWNYPRCNYYFLEIKPFFVVVAGLKFEADEFLICD